MQLMLASDGILRFCWACILLVRLLPTLRIVSWELTVFIAAEDLHLACFSCDAAVSRIKLRILLLKQMVQRLLQI